jgi:AcrR family transcriptional regulator
LKIKSINEETLKRIVSCSKQEFLRRGFKDASLRTIAASAGVTTGAIYGYFENKDALFNYVVTPLCDQIGAWMTGQVDAYRSSDAEPGSISTEKTFQSIEEIYAVLYAHFDEAKLLADCAQGSSRENYFHDIVRYEVEHTMGYIEEYRKFNGTPTKDIDAFVIHALSESYVNSLLEPIRHNLSLEEALKRCEPIGTFYTQGWLALLNT